MVDFSKNPQSVSHMVSRGHDGKSLAPRVWITALHEAMIAELPISTSGY